MNKWGLVGELLTERAPERFITRAVMADTMRLTRIDYDEMVGYTKMSNIVQARHVATVVMRDAGCPWYAIASAVRGGKIEIVNGKRMSVPSHSTAVWMYKSAVKKWDTDNVLRDTARSVAKSLNRQMRERRLAAAGERP